MGKTACKKAHHREPENPVYYCKKCKRKALNEKKLCKARKIS